MPRTKSPNPRTRIHLNLRADILARLEPYITDPARSTPIYGARSRVIEQLLVELFDAIDEGRDSIPIRSILRTLVSLRTG